MGLRIKGTQIGVCGVGFREYDFKVLGLGVYSSRFGVCGLGFRT
jgi:hypothetical protein